MRKHNGMRQPQEDWEEGPSRSELKRQAEHLQDLGKELTALGGETLAKIDLPDEVREAIREFHNMRSFGAKRRQLQLIGKYMRALDAVAVRMAIDRASGVDKTAVAAHHQSEKLREALIAEDSALASFIEQFPDCEIQQVRNLIRSARKEKELNKPPKSARALYKLIYAMVLPPLDLMARESSLEDSDE